MSNDDKVAKAFLEKAETELELSKEYLERFHNPMKHPLDDGSSLSKSLSHLGNVFLILRYVDYWYERNNR